MPNITIIGKEGHNVLQQTTANEVKITEKSVVVIKVQKEDVKSMVQNGDALVITLKNGETIVIDNFFNIPFKIASICESFGGYPSSAITSL